MTVLQAELRGDPGDLFQIRAAHRDIDVFGQPSCIPLGLFDIEIGGQARISTVRPPGLSHVET